MPHISIFAFCFFFRRSATSVSSFRFYFASQQKYEIKKNKHIRFFVVYPEAHCVSDAIICTYIQIIRSNARHKTAETSGASERRMAILSKETLFIFYYSPFQPFLCAIFSVPFFLLLSLPGISASQFRLCGGAGERETSRRKYGKTEEKNFFDSFPFECKRKQNDSECAAEG